MMTRSEVYRRIDGERDYQQQQGKPDQRDILEWSDSIHYYNNALLEDLNIGNITGALANIRKVAALAVACLEQHGCPARQDATTPSTGEQP